MSFISDEELARMDRAVNTLPEILESYRKARQKHAPQRGPHEGYAIILEELDELWDEVRAWQPDFANRAEMRKEALHVATMAFAFIIEVCDK